ncbi:MAG: hypothetical protein B7Y57_30180 [Rhodospirillales bacterium 35-66-84]|nr:MAG: hypothetical protein B7Y57_30180 [Rhodospirillales bacterium 35-66-84]
MEWGRGPRRRLRLPCHTSPLTGNVAKLLATIAVIVVGIAWMFGYLDLRKAAYVVLGIGIIFGAAELVSTISGG